jgi:hypothetical protein
LCRNISLFLFIVIKRANAKSYGVYYICVQKIQNTEQCDPRSETGECEARGAGSYSAHVGWRRGLLWWMQVDILLMLAREGNCCGGLQAVILSMLAVEGGCSGGLQVIILPMLAGEGGL